MKERSRIRAVQMDSLRGLLAIRRMDIVLNAQIREMCGVTKWVNDRIDEGILQWFSKMERMENDDNANRVYVGECTDSCSEGRLWKRWIDTTDNCFKKMLGYQASRENGGVGL